MVSENVVEVRYVLTDGSCLWDNNAQVANKDDIRLVPLKLSKVPWLKP